MTSQNVRHDAKEEIASLFERMVKEPRREKELAETIRERLRDMRRHRISMPVDFVVLEAQLERRAARQ